MFPNEHFAALYGTRSPEGDVLITKIAPVVHIAKSHSIEIDEPDIYRSKRAALRKDEDWIGTIHSHCDTTADPVCWHLSKSDIRSALKWGEAVCGVVFVDSDGHRTDVHWYIPNPIPKVTYF